MFVYLNGQKERTQARYTYTISPGQSGLINSDEIPSAWLEEDGETPRTFTLEFYFGRAEVDEQLGQWLVYHGICAVKCSHPLEREGSIGKSIKDTLLRIVA